MGTIITDSSGVHPLTKTLGDSGYEVSVVYTSLFYLLHNENTWFCFLYGQGKIRDQKKNISQTRQQNMHNEMKKEIKINFMQQLWVIISQARVETGTELCPNNGEANFI